MNDIQGTDRILSGFANTAKLNHPSDSSGLPLIRPLVLEQKSNASPMLKCLKPQELVKYSLLDFIHRDSESVDLGWGPEMCISSKLAGALPAQGPPSPFSGGRLQLSHLLCGAVTPWQFRAPRPMGLSSRAEATAARAAAGAAQPPESRQLSRKTPGLAWLRVVVGWRGGAGPGARGWGLATGGGAQRTGLPPSAIRRRGRVWGHNQRAARRGLQGSPPKGKVRRARCGVFLPGSCCLSPGASGPQTGSGNPEHLHSVQGPAAEPGVYVYHSGAGAGAFGVCSGSLLPSQDSRTRRQLCSLVLL